MAKAQVTAAKAPRVKANAPGTPTLIPEEDLLLDPDNPRLAGLTLGDRSQDSLVKTMWSEMAVAELALSIKSNGFFENERLLVVAAPPKLGKNKFVVLEGNRRLAAVKLLLHERLRKLCNAEALPILDAAQAKSLERLPVLLYEKASDIWQYIGFKHINGVMVWDPYSKATYISRMVGAGLTLDQIADFVGDTHRTVKRMYQGYTVLDQAEEVGYDLEVNKDAKLKFSHLYTALGYPSFREYIGVSGTNYAEDRPVKKKNHPALKRTLTWLYGDVASKKPPVVISQNPDLGRLRDVLGDKESREAFESGKFSLDDSFEMGFTDAKRFKQAVLKAKAELQKAKGLSQAYDGEDDTFVHIEQIVAAATAIRAETQPKVKGRLA